MGIKEIDVIKLREKYGSNEIVRKNRNTFLKLLLESFGDPIIKILLVALMIKVVFLFQSFDWFETIGILIAVLLATLISTLSEYGSEAAFSKLQEDSSKIFVKVYRDGILKEICIDDIVVNDVVLLSTGDKIPADGKIIEGNVSVDESSLNGESKEIKKNMEENKNNLYRGTIIYDGTAKMIVLKVGENTLYGSITKELVEETSDSPLKIRLRGLARNISKMGYLGAFLVSFSYLFSNIIINNNYDITLIMNTLTNYAELFDHLLYALTIGVTVIVLAVPEGLPMMITLVLSSNMKKMLKDNVLVRKMVGVETAGNLNLLLTDKTGTLTKGELLVIEIVFADNLKIKKHSELIKYKELYNIIGYSLYYNNESIKTEDKIIGGNYTDKALLKFVDKPNTNIKVISKKSFNSSDKYSEIEIFDKKGLTFLKGASEVLVPKCEYFLNKKGEKKKIITKSIINNDIKKLTNNGSRVIVLVQKDENDYIYIGAVSIKDELRKETINAVKMVESAGVNIIMITGDSKDTARVIAKEAGILKNNLELVLTSDEFNKMEEEDIIKNMSKIKVIARALPQDKSKLVKIAQSMNLVVGMTGDGVNDAAALKKADVGFAMGSGTEVAKEAGDIVILDDNILSISKAILYGRTIFKSIRKFIIYQLSVNVCALLISIIGSLIGINEPITIIQMLWINMIMDTFAALAFSFEPPLKEYMEEKPKRKDESIMNKYMFSQIAVSGFYSSALCLLFLKLDFVKEFFISEAHLYTAYFALFIFLGIFNSFNARTSRINIFADIKRNPIFILIFSFIIIAQIYLIYYGGELFRTSGLLINEFSIIIILSLTILPIDFARKVVLKKNDLKTGV